MAGSSTRWFVVASPTGSTISEFFNTVGVTDVNQTGSSYVNLSAIAGGGEVSWGDVGNFPTYSAYSPGIYIRDLANSNYTTSFYTYTDLTDDNVTSIQQDLQKIFFPGIVTGSLSTGFGGKVFQTGSAVTPIQVGSNATGSIGFQAPSGVIGALDFNDIVSMSIAPNSFNRVNFSTFLPTVNNNFRLIYRDFQSSAEAVYNVVSYDLNAIIDQGFFGYQVTYVSSTGSLILNNSSSVTFINTVENQQTFYVVGVANPAAGLPFASQSTVGISNAFGDLRSGIIKVYATESNAIGDWNILVRTVSGDNSSNYTNPSYVALNHNLMMFTASAGNSGSWELLA